MAKKPDTPCAGGCGKLLWGGGSSLPAGQRMCRDCRERGPEVRPKRVIACAACGAEVVTRDPARRMCSTACRDLVRRGTPAPTSLRRCVACGEMRPLTAASQRCATCARERRRAGWRRKNAIRRGAVRAGQQISIEQLGARDRWRCHLCGQRVDGALRFPDPQSPTFDHLVPISEGGTDDPANVRLAHRRCNTSRGTRGIVQLMLIG